MTPLETIIGRRITQTGPITVADYMSLCLSHPEHGYYITRDPLGTEGDFITAPEISQMFGELIGLWLAQAWIDQGSPKPFILAELGPGRGTLMADAMRATRKVSGFHASMQLWLVETSPALRAKQALNLPNAHWAATVRELPQLPLFLIANEFFDSLPVRQFVRDGFAWRERMVGLSEGKLIWGLAPEFPDADLDRQFPNLPNDIVVETCLPGQTIAAQVGSRILEHGGAILTIDYGEWNGTGDTLQALQRHQKIDPLQRPGMADITAHVNFSALTSASGLRALPLIDQGQFLWNLGIAQRAAALAVNAPESVNAALHRLTDSSEMGTLFKVLCLTYANAPIPPGFAQ